MIEKLPKLPPNFIIKRKGNKFLFLNTTVPDWIITNSNGAIALKLCNGRRTIGEISSILSSFAKRDVKDEINNFFQEIISSTNFFSTTNKESDTFHPYNLNSVHLNLTNKCNLRCIYCYVEERSDSKHILQLKDYLTIIDSINNIRKNADIVLTGGEPLLANHALELADYAKRKGNQVHLLTNGVLINEANAKKISELCDLIKVSVDGSVPEIHDFHRGKGSFDKTLRAIDVLSQNNAKLQVSMTVTGKNISNIESMVNKFGSMLSFAPLFKAGRAKKTKNLAITGDEYYHALSSVNGVNPLSYLCSSLAKAKEKRIMKCAIGDAEISISDNGDVYPCHLLHIPQFLAGNVKEQSLESIYQTSDVLKACRKLTVLEINECKKCEIRFICGGACRARAFYEKKRIDTSDDFCEYEKLAFINGLFESHFFD
jgi:radical SAM protein with 4Fe4S-binding SPASM domain